MHLIECDGCKRQELYFKGLANRELESRAPDGWGWKRAYFKGSNHHWDAQRELLIHACNIDCAVPAVLRVKQALPGVGLRLTNPEWHRTGEGPEFFYARWEGFGGASKDEWAALGVVSLDDGGQPPSPKVTPHKKSKWKSAAFLDVPLATDVFLTIQEGTVVPAGAVTFQSPTDPTPGLIATWGGLSVEPPGGDLDD